MDWTMTSTLDAPGVLRIGASGHAVVEEFQRLVNEMVSREDWHSDIRLLVDCRSVIVKGVQYDEVDRTGMILLNHAVDFGTAKIALVTAKGVGYGIGKQFKHVTEAKTDICVEVFLDESAAFRWIVDEQSNTPLDALIQKEQK